MITSIYAFTLYGISFSCKDDFQGQHPWEKCSGREGMAVISTVWCLLGQGERHGLQVREAVVAQQPSDDHA